MIMKLKLACVVLVASLGLLSSCDAALDQEDERRGIRMGSSQTDPKIQQRKLKKGKKEKKAKKAKKSKKKTVNTDDDSFDVLSEDDDGAGPKWDYDKKKIGFALFGNGAHSVAVHASILRAFRKQKIIIGDDEVSALDAVYAMSSLSGGNVANFIYHYARVDSDTILDVKYDGDLDPTTVTNEQLDAEFDKQTIFDSLTKSLVGPFLIGYFTVLFNGGPFMQEIVYTQFLAPFGIPPNVLMTDVDIRNDVKSFPIAEAAMVGPTALWPEYYSQNIYTSFVDVYNERVSSMDSVDEIPGSFIADNELLYSWAKETGFNIPLPVYGTNKEFHIPLTPSDGEKGTMIFDKIGDKSADPIEFDGPVVAPYDKVSSESNPFTLEKLLGMATDNVGFYPKGHPSNMDNILGDIVYRPIAVDIPFSVDDKETVISMAFTDGGVVEGQGLPGILTEKPTNVIFTVNPGNLREIEGFPLRDQIYAAFMSYFSVIPAELFATYGPMLPPGSEEFENVTNIFQGVSYTNAVFDASESNWLQLSNFVESMEKLKAADEPMIGTMKGLDVITNPFWGIEGGFKVDLTVILMNGVSEKFADLLPEDVAAPPPGKSKVENGLFTNTDFIGTTGPFPYPTINEVKPIEIPFGNQTISFELPGILTQNFTPKSLRMASLYVEWAIERAWDGLKDADGNVVFDGFSKIFDEEESDVPISEPKMKVKKVNKAK